MPHFDLLILTLMLGVTICRFMWMTEPLQNLCPQLGFLSLAGQESIIDLPIKRRSETTHAISNSKQEFTSSAREIRNRSSSHHLMHQTVLVVLPWPFFSHPIDSNLSRLNLVRSKSYKVKFRFTFLQMADAVWNGRLIKNHPADNQKNQPSPTKVLKKKQWHKWN